MQALSITILGLENGEPPLSAFAEAVANFEVEVHHLNAHSSAQTAGICATIHAPWNKINRLQSALEAKCQANGWHLHTLNHEFQQGEGADQEETPLWLPYTAHVMAAKQQHILQPITQFWLQANAVLREVTVTTPIIAHQYRPTNTLIACVDIPCDQSIISLRDGFAELCDELNADGILEPLR